MWHAKNKSGHVKAFVNSDAAKKHALSEEVVSEAGAFSYGAKPPRKGTEKYRIAQANKKYWDSRPVIEPNDQMVGNAKVTKDKKNVSEDKDPCSTAVKEEIKTYGSWVLKQKSMISKTAAEKSKKKVTKGKTDIADKEAFDAKNAGGTPPFDPFFGR